MNFGPSPLQVPLFYGQPKIDFQFNYQHFQSPQTPTNAKSIFQKLRQTKHNLQCILRISHSRA